ncbi:hypothetical protein L6452_43746 [Arctium lappa]|uniref:Uncharacterized protein n=1 Tax=Arctium lappa TaxID=4217 RepID=A0ACB8XDR5_ARCLA|nr:hypothetical protein L6452_43746 [Arctium lappa]
MMFIDSRLGFCSSFCISDEFLRSKDAPVLGIYRWLKKILTFYCLPSMSLRSKTLQYRSLDTLVASFQGPFKINDAPLRRVN